MEIEDQHVRWLLGLTPAQFWQWHSSRSHDAVAQSLSATLEELRRVSDLLKIQKGD